VTTENNPAAAGQSFERVGIAEQFISGFVCVVGHEASVGHTEGWWHGPDGEGRFYIDDYMDERSRWAEWRGIRIQNWHRELSRYMQLLLGQGLELRFFGVPEPGSDDARKNARYWS
jgi:hypothetical protein